MHVCKFVPAVQILQVQERLGIIMSKKVKYVPEVVNALPAKSGKGKKFVKFVVVASAIAAGATL